MTDTTTTTTTRQTNIRLLPATLRAVSDSIPHDDDAPASEQIRSALEAWPWLIRGSLREVRGQLSAGECNAIIDVMNGCHLTGSMLGQHLAANVADTPGLGRKWGCDQEALIRRLNALPLAQRIAIELWAGRHWCGQYQDAEWCADHMADLAGA